MGLNGTKMQLTKVKSISKPRCETAMESKSTTLVASTRERGLLTNDVEMDTKFTRMEMLIRVLL